jgi:DNA-binding MarR family transcriptional regulator
MKGSTEFSQTYLYKIHTLSSTLDKAFDMILRTYADLTLSQFMVLMAISEHDTINQRKVAQYLSLSAVAIKRQVDIAEYKTWVKPLPDGSIRGTRLQLTRQGEIALHAGLQALEDHLFHIFDDHNRSTNLMQHLNMLLSSARAVIANEEHKQLSMKENIVYANS